MKLDTTDKIGPSVALFAGVIAVSLLLASCGGGGYGGGGGSNGTLAPGSLSLSSPANMATGVSATPTLTWTASLYATGYYVYVKRDADATYPAPVTVTGTNYTTGMLAASTVYDWQVTAFNGYGMATAGPFTFTTGP